MGFANRAFVAAGVGFAAAAIVGCGSSGGSLLSASQSDRLSEQLNRVTQALDESNCTEARAYLADFQSSVDSLGGVNSTLISDLDQGASTIQSLTDNECQTPVKTVKKTHPKTTTSTTTTATTSTFTVPSTTTTYTAPAYTTTTYSTPETTPSGGSCFTDCTTTTTSTTSSVNSTTSPTGGTGLGSDTTDTTDTTTTSDTTTTVSTTDTSSGGF